MVDHSLRARPRGCTQMRDMSHWKGHCLFWFRFRVTSHCRNLTLNQGRLHFALRIHNIYHSRYTWSFTSSGLIWLDLVVANWVFYWSRQFSSPKTWSCYQAISLGFGICYKIISLTVTLVKGAFYLSLLLHLYFAWFIYLIGYQSLADK
jgi:hypothetical protein